MNDEFYIGWEDKAPKDIRKAVHRVVLLLFFMALAAPITLAIAQRMIGAGVFEWGNVKNFTGFFQAQPYPHLLVSRPGNVSSQLQFSTYYLVAQWKFGLPPAAIAQFDGQTVALKGTLIYRGNQTMIETRPEWIHAKTNRVSSTPPQTLSLGRQTFVGEIVDSKCFLGVMNPGQLTPHRACAVRCVSGGVPPILLVRQKDRPPAYFLLVSADGRPVNEQVLDLVAEPVEITGEVEKQGDLLILRADPSTYRRIK